MTVVIGLADAKLHLTDLVDYVAAGEEIIVVRSGRPVARLVPMGEPVTRARPPLDEDRTRQPGFDDQPTPQIGATQR